jgi:hypothetical protein
VRNLVFKELAMKREEGASDELIVVWQGLVKGRRVVFGRVVTSVPGVLRALERAGLSREKFNSMVSGVGVSQFLPNTLFVRGTEAGRIFSLLKSEA